MNRGRLRHCNGLQTPNATGPSDREGGSEVSARSQDTGLAVLVVIPLCGINFSVKEKDEASLFRECGMGSAECLHSPFCRGLKVLSFQASRWSLNRKPVPRNFSGGPIERSAYVERPSLGAGSSQHCCNV